MINSNANTPVQAFPLVEGKVNLGAGTYFVNNVIHCETDSEFTFGESATTYTMIAGEDRAYTGEITVVSGTVSID